MDANDFSLNDLSSFVRLLDFLGDPAKFRPAITELVTATADARNATAEATAAKDELETQKTAQAVALETERAAHVDQLQRERAEFAMAVNRKNAELADREAGVAKAEQANAAGVKANSDLKADLEARIASFNRAVDPRPYPRAAR